MVNEYAIEVRKDITRELGYGTMFTGRDIWHQRVWQGADTSYLPLDSSGIDQESLTP